VFKETKAGKKFLVVTRVIDLRASNQVFLNGFEFAISQ